VKAKAIAWLEKNNTVTNPKPVLPGRGLATRFTHTKDTTKMKLANNGINRCIQWPFNDTW